MLTNIEDIKNNNPELYEKLIKHNCMISYNGVIIYEGLYDETFDYKNKNKQCCVITFDINESDVFICLAENNELLNTHIGLTTDTFDTLFEDSKLYNSLINKANNLPLLGFCVNENYKSRGVNIQKIYDYVHIVNNENIK